MLDIFVGAVFFTLVVLAWVTLRKNPEAKHGFWSYSACWVGGFWVLLAVIGGAGYPRYRSVATACLSSIKQNSLALIMYAGDHDDQLPLAAWTDRTFPYRKYDELRCPRANGSWGYGMNGRVINSPISKWDDAPLLLLAETSLPGANEVVSKEDELAARHFGTISIALTDGSAKRLSLSKPNDPVRWEPNRELKVTEIPDRTSPDDQFQVWVQGVRDVQVYVAAVTMVIALLCSVVGLFRAPAHRRGFWLQGVILAVIMALVLLTFLLPVYA